MSRLLHSLPFASATQQQTVTAQSAQLPWMPCWYTIFLVCLSPLWLHCTREQTDDPPPQFLSRDPCHLGLSRRGTLRSSLRWPADGGRLPGGGPPPQPGGQIGT